MADCSALLGAIEAYIMKADKDMEDTLDAAGFIDAADTISEASKLEEEIAQALIRESEYVESSIQQASDLSFFTASVWPTVKENDHLDEELQVAFRDSFSRLMPQLVQDYTSQTDSEIPVHDFTKRTVNFIEGWSESLGKLMKLNSHEEIESILVTNVKAGKGVADVTRALQESGIRDEYYKARRAALTELLRAHSYAQQEAFIQSPAVESKMWCHTGGHLILPRWNHVEMDGQMVPVNEPYILNAADGSVHTPMVPRDTNLPAAESINCHCISQPIVSQEVLGLSIEERMELQRQAIENDDGLWKAELDAMNRAKAGIA